MKVEHENLRVSIRRSDQRRRNESGTSVVIACAKSALTTTASNRSVPRAERMPTARRPSNRISCTGEPSRTSTPDSRRDTPHRGHHRAASAARMPDAELVLDERQDAEQAGAAERRHAEIFALERKRQPHTLVLEVAGKVPVQRLMRPQAGKRFQHAGPQQVEHAVERRFQSRLKGFQLGAVVVHESAQGVGVPRIEPGDFARHFGHVGGGADLAALFEQQPVLRIDAQQLNLAAECPFRRPRIFRTARADTGRMSARGRTGMFQAPSGPRSLPIGRRHGQAARRR